MSNTPEVSRDLLGEAIAAGGFSRDDIGDVFAAWLWAQFMDDRWAKLDQAQVPDSQKTRLAAVFVDLSVEARTGRSESTFVQGWLAGGHAHTLTQSELWRRQLGRRDDPSYVPVGRATQGWGDRMGRPHFLGTAEVLIGGPGQGKSTVTQMLAQCHRVAYLLPRVASATEERGRALLEFVSDIVRAGLAPAERPLLPVRVDLARFAAWRAGSYRSLADYLAAEVARRTAENVTSSDVTTLFQRLPWLLLLDGLDEVPSGAGRDSVVRCISEALISLRGSDGAMLVTTRPQGYRSEFGSLEHRRLAALDAAQITQYAARLAAARYADQPDDQEIVIERLREALADEATARLLQTPLQVTIMVTLVMQIGRAPRERWRLFTEYYRAVYNRETGKGGELAKLLSTMRQHIDAIHRHVGLLLQVSSERQGETDATFSTDVLREVALARLDAEGFAADRANALAEQIVEAAVQRLVFLVEVQQGGRLGFEIRSLQEYMGAWALTVGDDALVTERLRLIAPVAHWRNTFVFAVGSVFDDGSAALRDAVTVGLCTSLQGVAGRDLALDLLDDKTVLSRPKVAEALVSFTLSDLDELPYGRCAEVLQQAALQDEYDALNRLHGAVTARLNSPDADHTSAWDQLLSLSVIGDPWTVAVAQERWPSDERRGARLAVEMGLVSWIGDDGSDAPAFFQRLFDDLPLWREIIDRVSPTVLRDEFVAYFAERMRAENTPPPRPHSPLASYAVWLRLGLPDPPPRTSGEPNSDDDFSPTIRKVIVRGLRALRDVEFTLPAPEPGRGQCVLVLGKNGSGKTTLLRALMFALVDPVITDVALQQSSSRYLNLSQGATVADCVVETEHGVYHTEIGSRGGLEFARARSPKRPRRPFVVAYGCRRGSATGSGDRDPGGAAFDDVGTLFDRPWGLVHCEAWLRQLYAAGNGDLLVYRAVERVLLRVLPGVERIFFDGATLRVSGPAVGEVDFGALSDGYLTTAGFVADIVYRWKLRAARLGQKLSPDFVDTMMGIALIDEIDLHLHPAWQTHVLDDLRVAFPLMTFVGTTHNPLTLAGTRHVIELERLEDGVRATTLSDDARLMTVAQIYRTFFSVADLFPHPLGEKLRRYGLLAGDPTRSLAQDDEVSRLRRELEAEGVDPGWEPVPRAEAPEGSR